MECRPIDYGQNDSGNIDYTQNDCGKINCRCIDSIQIELWQNAVDQLSVIYDNDFTSIIDIYFCETFSTTNLWK